MKPLQKVGILAGKPSGYRSLAVQVTIALSQPGSVPWCRVLGAGADTSRLARLTLDGKRYTLSKRDEWDLSGRVIVLSIACPAGQVSI